MRPPVLAAMLLAAATAACGRTPGAATPPGTRAPREARISTQTEPAALAALAALAPTGADWEDRLAELPDAAVRPVAIALLRAGDLACTAVHEEEMGCGDTERSFEPVPPDATLADPCLRRHLALWALEHLEPGDVPAVAGALEALLALPAPEDELARAAFAVVPDHDDELRLRLIAVAAAGHHAALADEQVGRLAPAGAARALIEHGREVGLDHLGARPPVGVLRAALAGGLSSARALEVLEQLTPADLRDPSVATTVRTVAATADCEVAARAAGLLAEADDPGSLPGAAPLTDEAAAVRALCVAGHLGEAELAAVVATLIGGDLERVTIDRTSWYDPDDVPDDDGDGDPYTTTARDTVAADAIGAGALADWLPTSCDGGGCYAAGSPVTFQFGARADGTVTLDTVTLERQASEGCGC